MIVSEIERSDVPGGWELAANVIYETPPRESVRLWFRGPAEHRPEEHLGDVILTSLLPQCMLLHEPLTIEALVSEELAAAARDGIVPPLREAFPRLAGLELHAPMRKAAPTSAPGSRGSASFFSGGLDSWYTALSNQEELRYLIFIHGFDIPLANETLMSVAWRNAAAAAQTLGLKLIPLSTNLRDLLYEQSAARVAKVGMPRFARFANCWMSSFLPAVATTLRRSINRIRIPAGFAEGQEVPRPVVEARWSTPELDVVVDGTEHDRIGKIRWIADHAPETLASLRVCGDKSGSQLNCGICGKCLRTLAELRAGDALHLATSFPVTLHLNAIRRATCYRDSYWDDIVVAARQKGDVELERAVEVFLGRRYHWRRLLDGLGRHTLRILGRPRR